MKNKIQKIATLYTLLLMAGFPLYMTNKYYDIQDDKMYFMMYVTAAFMAAVCVMGIILFVKERKNIKTAEFNNNPAVNKNTAGDKKSTTEGKESTAARLIGIVKSNTSLPDRFALCFFIVLLISTIFSKWQYEAFWGNMGRYQGLYMWIFYMAGYLMISRFYTPRRWHINIFMLIGIIVCGWGVLDFFFKSPFGWQIAARDYMAFDFSSTIGNVNLLTGFDGIILLVASALFIGNGDKAEPENSGSNKRDDNTYGNIKTGSENSSRSTLMLNDALYLVTAFTAFMGLICGFSDNAFISVGTAVCFLPFFAFGNGKRMVRYLTLLAAYAGAFVCIGSLIASGRQTVSIEHWGMLLEVCVKYADKLKVLFAALIIISIAAKLIYSAVNKKSTHESLNMCGKKKLPLILRSVWAALGVMAVFLIIYIFYDANTGGHPELYAPYSNLLIFNADWGTRRGFNWNLALGYIKDFPFFKKLFGTGPETYPIYTYSYDYYNMVNAYNEVYDSPHNEWLQYLFTTGILGFVSYYGWVITSIISGCRARMKMHNIGTAFAFGALVYTLVSFVNISAPCLTPMVILCMGVASAAGRSSAYNKE
ncbi:MAG: O-antigen ligase family protein [Lachnospiraceae bacterium]|nr:O-antigen ligase family protein [Lachnospiraceae bacterium]